MNRTERANFVTDRLNKLIDMYEKNGYKKGIDFYQTASNTIEFYDKDFEGIECVIKIQMSCPTGARDGTFVDPCEKAREYQEKQEKRKQSQKNIENKKEQQQKKEQEKQETYQLITEFLQNNSEVSAMHIQKNINKPLTLVVMVLRQLEKENKLIKIDKEKNLPFLYKLV